MPLTQGPRDEIGAAKPSAAAHRGAFAPGATSMKICCLSTSESGVSGRSVASIDRQE